MEEKRWRQHIQWRDHFTQEVKWSHFIQLSMERYMELIYKAISYISSKKNKYYKGEISISKDEKLKLKVFTSVAELPSDAE